MAWVKIPKENHALFYERLPKDKRIETLQMFGAAAAKVNGYMFGGLFARSFMVKLGDADYAAALTLDGAEPFDPMGSGRVMSNTVMMPESLMDEPAEMTAWLQKALDYSLSLPPKAVKTKTAAKPKIVAKTKTAAKAKSATKNKTAAKAKTKTAAKTTSAAKATTKTAAKTTSAAKAKTKTAAAKTTSVAKTKSRR
ncbi:MAG: TfoX/Sxy family protein [Kofleriaceae bacterium]